MRTSVTLLLDDAERLASIQVKNGRRQSFMINECLRRYFAKHHKCLKKSRISRLVEYQPDGFGYCIVGLIFDVDVYNLAVNFRVFCRVSVSSMVTKALAEFFDEVIAEIEGKKIVIHNYVDYKHLIRHNTSTNCPQWQIIWEVEGEKPKT